MKKILVIIGGIAISAALVGCSESEYVYSGKTIGEYELEERIADMLEVENPELDIEVDIYEEVED